jgi:hypothetical protein
VSGPLIEDSTLPVRLIGYWSGRTNPSWRTAAGDGDLSAMRGGTLKRAPPRLSALWDLCRFLVREVRLLQRGGFALLNHLEPLLGAQQEHGRRDCHDHEAGADRER